jgi:arginyl-tRNA synthetase
VTPVELSRTVQRAVRRAVDGGQLSVAVPDRVVVAPPGPGGCGDYATGIALQLARPAERSPLQVAEILRPHLLDEGRHSLADVVVTGPGFLNFRLVGTSPGQLVRLVLERGADGYGHTSAPDPRLLGIRQLRVPCDLRAFVVADCLVGLFRSQGVAVGVGPESSPPDPAWAALLRGDLIPTAPADQAPSQVQAQAPSQVQAQAPAQVQVQVQAEVQAEAQVPAPASVSAPGPAPAPGSVVVRPLPLSSGDAAGLLALGRDAGRWALLHPAGRDRVRVGGEHLVQRESNPLFRARYAHARTRALARNAADLGFAAEPGGGTADEAPLLAALADHPRVLSAAALHRAPDRLARHLVDVADLLAPLLGSALPSGPEKPSAAHRARLALVQAAGTVLAGGLTLLGIDAPDVL